MNWIKANKFLTGFFAVMLVGIGVLGYFLCSASSAFDAADENYQDKADELNRLRHLPLYPNTKNLKALEAQKTEAAELVAQFQAQLATKGVPLQEMTPAAVSGQAEGFRDDDRGESGEKPMWNCRKDKKFYLGFDPYESRPPEKEAVGPLTRQLASDSMGDGEADRSKDHQAGFFEADAIAGRKEPGGREQRKAGSPGSPGGRTERNWFPDIPVDLELKAKQKSISLRL